MYRRNGKYQKSVDGVFLPTIPTRSEALERPKLIMGKNGKPCDSYETAAIRIASEHEKLCAWFQTRTGQCRKGYYACNHDCPTDCKYSEINGYCSFMDKCWYNSPACLDCDEYEPSSLKAEAKKLISILRNGKRGYKPRVR